MKQPATIVHALCAMILLMSGAPPALSADNPLSISILKTEPSGNHTYLLFAVDNSTEQRFEWTQWSCVFLNGSQPVHEQRSNIQNVPPRSRAIQRVIQSYGGPFDKVECRFMDSRPKVPL